MWDTLTLLLPGLCWLGPCLLLLIVRDALRSRLRPPR